MILSNQFNFEMDLLFQNGQEYRNGLIYSLTVVYSDGEQKHMQCLSLSDQSV